MSTADVQQSSGIQKQSRVNVTVSKDIMTASILLRRPQAGDDSITLDEILDSLQKEGVIFGINTEAIEQILKDEAYNTPLKVAEGEMPKRGPDSEFIFHFETAQSLKPQEDEDGHIDYKNINFIQNIEKGGVLVTRVPAKPGIPGTNVQGKSIKGPDGRSLPFKNGDNTEISADGNTVIASCSGAIVFLNNKVSVNDVLHIKGDVDFSVGNIDCRGSVRVSGTIKTGFSIKTDGDLEVNGNVEDATLDVQGNIMVKGGFFGKGHGIMKSGGDIYVKFAEGQKLIAGGDIAVGGEVVNCIMVAKGNVHVKGAKGKIVGGETKAKKEIRASFLGTESGTLTTLMVAYDNELMKKYNACTKEIDRLYSDKDRVKQVMVGLYKLQMDKKLTAEQTIALKKLEEFKAELPGNLETLGIEKQKIEEELKKLKGAHIIAEKMLFSGVKAHFGLIYREMMEDKSSCILKLDNDRIFVSEYNS
ncbi:MAG: DUF342 domain-containing protein [Calditrichaeota bacterium]|nr:MAG: DUF342 domain-containing protein [Calditrichota bacterium]